MSQPRAAEPAAAAGWYPDPAGSGLLRHWDGGRWTEHVMPPPAGLTGQWGAAPGYPAGAPPYWAPQYRRETNGMAVASLVLSISGFVSYGIGCILGIVFGHVALSQISRNAGTQDGRALAIAGLIIGYVGIAFGALIILALLFYLPAAG